MVCNTPSGADFYDTVVDMSHKVFSLAHISDLHLGYSSGTHTTRYGVNWREEDGYSAWRETVESIIAYNADDSHNPIGAVLIAGDVFHTPHPSIRSILEAHNGVRTLADNHIPVYILTGNHDTSDIVSEISATAVLNDPEHGVYAHYEPYVTHTLADSTIILHMVSHHIYSEQDGTFSSVQPHDGALNIFTTHGSVLDPITHMILHTQHSPREVIIPDDIMYGDNWDYRLLGHIHERGFVGSSDGVHDSLERKTFYNGSLIRRGFSDGLTQLGNGWTVWDIDLDTGEFTPHFHTVAQRPQIDLPVLDVSGLTAGEVNELILSSLTSIRDSMVTVDSDDMRDTFAYAPIVRQKVVNIDSVTRSGLNKSAIHDVTQPFLSWSLQLTAPQKSDTPAGHDSSTHTDSHLSTGTLSSQFSNWIDSSNEFNALHESLKEDVEKDTRAFIQKGQDSVLTTDGV